MSNWNIGAENSMGRRGTHMWIYSYKFGNNQQSKHPIWNFLWRKPKIMCLFSEFRCITYKKKRDNINEKIKYKTYKSIMVGYTKKIQEIHTIYMTQKPKGLLWVDILSGKSGKILIQRSPWRCSATWIKMSITSYRGHCQ